jgi:hypothetical protein
MYRILTEEKNVEQVKATLTGLGLDFTLYRARGSWHGQEENSLAIELDNISRNLAESTARTIKLRRTPYELRWSRATTLLFRRTHSAWSGFVPSNAV